MLSHIEAYNLKLISAELEFLILKLVWQKQTFKIPRGIQVFTVRSRT